MRSIFAAALFAGAALWNAASAQNLVVTNVQGPLGGGLRVPISPSSIVYFVNDIGAPSFVPASDIYDVQVQCLLALNDCVRSGGHRRIGEPSLFFGNSGQSIALGFGSAVRVFANVGTEMFFFGIRFIQADCVRSVAGGCLGLDDADSSPPTIAFTVGFPSPPDMDGRFPGGTSVFITEDISHASGCTRTVAGPAAVPEWDDGAGASPIEVTLPLEPGVYTFGVTCWNSIATTTETFDVRVAPSSRTCASSPGASNPPIAASYAQFFGTAFAGTTSASADFAPSSHLSVAIPVPAGAGGEGFFAASIAQSTATVALTLSTCPGDFTFATLPPDCVRIGNGKVLPWRIGTSAGEQAPGKCTLDAGRTWYLNAAFVNVALAPTCVGATCRATIVQSNVSVTQPIKPLAPAVDAIASLGASVAVAGDLMVAGLPDIEQSTGRAYVYRRGAAGTWALEAELLALDRAPGDAFGTSVSISADGATIFVGAPYDDHGALIDAGSARIFRRTGASWSDAPDEQILVASDAASNDRYGAAVDVSRSGAAFIVGAPSKDAETGEAYAFKASMLAASAKHGGVVPTHPIPHLRGKSSRAIGDKMGASVATDSNESGGHWVIGAPGANGGAGLVRAVEDVGGTFVRDEAVTAPTPSTTDGLGSSVDVTGNKFAAGAPGNSIPNDGVDDTPGSAITFARGEDGELDPPQELVPEGGRPGDATGASVAIGDHVLVVGSPLAGANSAHGGTLEDAGRIDVYRLSRQSGEFAYTQSQTGNDARPGDRYGASVATDDRTISVGAPARAARAGAAYPLDAVRASIFASGFE